MEAERWQRIEQLYNAALDREAGERRSFLTEACAGDATLRQEVEALLAANEEASAFLAAPALELEARKLAAEISASPLALEVGQEISHYKIISRIGAGGMGEVFLALDEKLERRVALKLLPVQFTQDDERLERFIREAKAASALNHPNIITIYEIGEVTTASGKTHFIATEFIEGETLRTWKVDEEKPYRQAINIAVQIASALASAHKAGIVHRDIKPENVMVRPDGLVKVLDFGLAKLTTQTSDSANTKARTLIQEMQTRPGMILGTLRYMSPEQARGRGVDARSDIFSLGVVLYELLTGQPLFAGDTDADVVAGIIRKQPPPLSEHLSEVPPELERVVQKALAKEADSRFQSAEEMRESLRALLAALPDTGDSPTKALPFTTGVSRLPFMTALSGIIRRPRVLTLVAAAIAVAGLVLLAALLLLRAAPHKPPPEAVFWYDEGTKSLRSGAYYGAGKALERAIHIDDKFTLAHARLAEAWTELDHSDKANIEILRARSLVGDISSLPRLEALYLQAITHIVLREFASAIEKYQQIAREVPEAEKAQAYLDLGRAYEKNEQMNKAIESYAEATKLAPSDAAAFLRLGILYGRQKNLESAKEAFQKAEGIYQALSNFEGTTEVLYQRGRLSLTLGKLSEARAHFERVLSITGTTANQHQQVRAMLALSSIYASEGQASQAEEQATGAIKLAQASGIESEATSGLVWLGNSFRLRGEYGDAEKHYKQALDLARRNGMRENHAWSLFELGSLRQLQNNTDEALSYVNQSLAFYRQGGYRDQLSKALILLARISRNKGDFETALQTFNELLKVGEEAGEQPLMAHSHEGIGSVLVRQEQYPEAARRFDESYKIRKSLNDRVRTGYAALNRASVLWQTGNYEDAKAALDEASVIARSQDGNNKVLLAFVHMFKGSIELSLRNFSESKTSCLQAIKQAGTEYKDIAVEARYTLGLAQSRSGSTGAGKLMCAEAVEMAKSLENPQLILSSALLAWAEAMLESGDPQGALETALMAQKNLALSGRQESEWRAWLVAARAVNRTGQEATAIKYASNADALRSGLEQRWGSEAYRGYLSRPDIKHALGQLGRVLNH